MHHPKRSPKDAGDGDEIPDIPKKQARQRSFVVEPILAGDVLSDRVSLVEFEVYEIAEKRNIPKILKALPPLDEAFSHLKRIQASSILVGPSTSLEEDREVLLRRLVEVDAEEGVLQRREVPGFKPLTKRQFEWAKKQWPTAFHADKRLEAILDGSFFGDAELERLRCLALHAERIQGCVVADPMEDVVAEAAADPNNPLGHPIMEAVEKLAARHRSVDDSEQYLATGFDVFLAREPCAMCAMALVHCRASRVFFLEPRARGGAFVSSWSIQHEPRINHHYEVFRLRESP